MLKVLRLRGGKVLRLRRRDYVWVAEEGRIVLGRWSRGRGGEIGCAIAGSWGNDMAPWLEGVGRNGEIRGVEGRNIKTFRIRVFDFFDSGLS